MEVNNFLVAFSNFYAQIILKAELLIMKNVVCIFILLTLVNSTKIY